MDALAIQIGSLSTWVFPVLWAVAGALALRRRLVLPGALLLTSAAATMLFNVLFAPDSAFTQGWQTDSPLTVAFDYQPLGFAAANGLPLLANLSLAGALLLLSLRSGK